MRVTFSAFCCDCHEIMFEPSCPVARDRMYFWFAIIVVVTDLTLMIAGVTSGALEYINNVRPVFVQPLFVQRVVALSFSSNPFNSILLS